MQNAGTALFIIKGGEKVPYNPKDIDQNTQFVISIALSTSNVETEGGGAYLLSHESFKHAEFVANSLAKFEAIKNNPKSTADEISTGLTQLKNDIKGYDTKETQDAQNDTQHQEQSSTIKINAQVKPLKDALKEAKLGGEKTGKGNAEITKLNKEDASNEKK